MIRGTTPDYVLTIPGVDLTGQSVFVTIAQTARGAARPADLAMSPAAYKLTKTGSDLLISSDGTDSTIAFGLSQQETLGLEPRPALIQVRFINSAGTARATEIKTLDVGPVLLEGVIAHE